MLLCRFRTISFFYVNILNQSLLKVDLVLGFLQSHFLNSERKSFGIYLSKIKCKSHLLPPHSAPSVKWDEIGP